MAGGSTGSTIKLSQRGIETSYLRYLADSAPGFLVLLFAFQRICADSGGHGPIGKAVCDGGGQTPGALLVLALGFFLATPLGLLVNGVGWFALGWLQARGAQDWIRLGPRSRLGWLISWTRHCYGADWMGRFGTSVEMAYRRTKLLEAALRTRSARATLPFEAVYGLLLFVRSCTLLAFLASLFAWYPLGGHPSSWLSSAAASAGWLGAAATLALLLSLLEYYKCVEVGLAWRFLLRDPRRAPEGETHQLRALLAALDREAP